ncbi:MAG: type 2 isopentenyl-diphosphate Delta-isomerase [Caldilineaceae bacterium]|nr:type 2 isopentenyl-diphosphate Delta-isomerase [Caldilineaceae bacterium]
MSNAGRKDDHIRINLEEDVGFHDLTTGFERFRFVHQALPELDLDAVDTSVVLFGKRLSLPILVSSMTGGTGQAGLLNRRLAEAVEHRNLAMGVGSQRIALEDGDTASSFAVRDYAPNALVFANLGAVQLNYGYTVDQCRRAVEMVEADALILHLNPLQEVVQPEGDVRWAGLLSRIEAVCSSLDVPVIAKEVGWGISQRTAKLLIDAGVGAIDVAGAGGTSWSEVEKHRAVTERQRRLAASFREWGIPTAASLEYVLAAREQAGRADLPVFASGGMRSGQDVAKAAALGAELTGLASPFLKRAVESTQAVVDEIDLLADELRISMFACGAQNIQALRHPGVLIEGVSSPLAAAGKPFQKALPAEPVCFKQQEQGLEIAASEPSSGVGLASFAARWLPRVEEEMRATLSASHPSHATHYAMMQYHMGWADEALQPCTAPSGKRIRPLLCLIACEAVGGNPLDAVSTAAAVEILHNFSLIHDDIEDGDTTRRHRPTLWSLKGVPQAINVGDGMFALAFKALLCAGWSKEDHAASSLKLSQTLAATNRFARMCVALTEGQHLDLSFEERTDVTVSDYLQMIQGKTAALIAGSSALGALLGGADAWLVECLDRFGLNIGLAFQIQDDILGIWGDPAVTGKAAGNDILRRKKSLPLLYTLKHPAAASLIEPLWRDDAGEESLPAILSCLEEVNAKGWTEERLHHHHSEGLRALSDAFGSQSESSLLKDLADELLVRRR